MLLKKKEKFIVIVGFISLVAFFTIYDLPFSNLIANKDSQFGQFFYMFGELPATFVGLASLALLTVSFVSEGKIAYAITCGFATFIMGFIITFQMIRYFSLDLFPNILYGLVLSMIMIFGMNHLSDKKKKYLQIYAIIAFLTMALGILTPNLIKIIWARPRYRILDGSDIVFQAWFIPGGFTLDDNWKSFPSGHSAAATVSLVYLYLPQLYDRLKGKEKILSFFIFTWIILVMISRVVRGDHFMTDTLFGSGIVLLIFTLLHNYFLKNKKLL